MNFIITEKCNKNCNFCFAEKNNTDMYLEDFLILANLFPVKILGGEPTLNPQFSNFINIDKEIILISNLIFDEKILLAIIKAENITGILANCSYLDKENMKTFAFNYSTLSQYKRDIAGGITIEDYVPLEYYIDYMTELRRHTRISSLRISLNFPNVKSYKDPNMYVNNKKLGSKIIEVIKTFDKLNNLNSLFVDCFMYPCMFEDIEFYNKHLKNINCAGNNNRGFPLDVLPDMTAIYCFPTADKIRIDLKTKNNIFDLEKELLEKYKSLSDKRELPTECKVCKYFKECNGPCLALYKT